MDISYILRVDEMLDEDDIIHTVYGITAIDEWGETVQSIPDIFFDKDKAEEFIELCNSEKLELIHLMDVVEDIFE